MPPNPNTLAAVVPAELCAAKTNTFSASDPILRRPCADREEKRVTHGRDRSANPLQCVT